MKKIIVCLKQVPDTNEIKIDPKTGTLIRDGVPSIINPDDLNALEEALVLKDKTKAEVVVISMGPPQAKEALNEALTIGADRAILISDRAFAGADTWATSAVLAKTIEKLAPYDLIICGRQAIDGDTAQVGPQIAERLQLPQITYAKKVTLKENSTLEVERALENGSYIMEGKLPLVITAIKELNIPRYSHAARIFKFYKENAVEVWGQAELKVDESQIGLKGSPTQVHRSFTPEAKPPGIMLKGSKEEMSKELSSKLKAAGLI